MDWLKNLLGSKKEASVDTNREVRSLTLELEERGRTITNLKNELERARAANNDTASIQIERLISDAATPVSQLLTQARLLEVEGKPVQAGDVMAVAKRVVRALEGAGMVIEGEAGDVVPFDPNRHEPLSSSSAFSRDEKVVVRFAGISYNGKIIRKAGVEQCRDV